VLFISAHAQSAHIQHPNRQLSLCT